MPSSFSVFSSSRRASLIRFLIALSACCLVAFVEISQPSLERRLNEGLRDIFLRIAASSSPETRLVIVDINDEDLRLLGPWPWPRSRIADLVEILLADYGARAVGLDIVFPEASIDDAAGDVRLAHLARYGPVALAQVLDYTHRPMPLMQGVLAGPAGRHEKTPGIPAHGFIGNHKGLAQARCAGNIGFKPDPDGVLRRIPLISNFQQQSYQHLALSLLTCADPHPRADIPLPAVGWWRIPFRRNLDAFTVIPASMLLRAEVPREVIQGRHVLVGSSSLSLGDRVSIPLTPLASGVLLHAEAASALLDMAEEKLPLPRDGRGWLLAWSVVSVCFAMFWIARWPAWRSVVLLLFMTGFWIALAFWGVNQQFEASVTSPLWGYFFLLLVAIPHEWRQSQRQTLKITETLSHYVARPVLDELLRRDITYSLEPQLREVTVLMADMEGYTRTTSSLPLEEAAQLTKDFLDCLTRPVLEHGGTLDRYSGDGLVAFWGAPLDCPDQADQAVSAALEILDAVDRFNLGWTGRGHAPLRVRIGIEHGQALVGDLGTPFRSTYTAVGDCINFASRLEAAARDLPTPLVIGSSANARLRAHKTYGVGSIRLRGTDRVMEIFTVKHGR